MTRDLYPLLYHTHHSQQSEDINFWLNLAASHGSPILELGCGTGRVLIRLAGAGHQVYGLDRDSDMLAFLQSNCPANVKLLIHLIQADMTAFHLNMGFKLIICPCNTLSTLFSNQRRSTLQCIHRHMHPSSLFGAALPNPHLLRELPTQTNPEIEEIFPHPVSGHPIQVSAAWKRRRRELSVDWYYDHLFPDGQIERTAIRIKHDLAQPEAYMRELERASLHIVEIFGDFDGSRFSKDSPHLILVARKDKDN
jgi:SAM-dependent methyltransferase